MPKNDLFFPVLKVYEKPGQNHPNSLFLLTISEKAHARFD